MNRSLAVVIVLSGMVLVTIAMFWIVTVVNEAQRDLEDGIVMPHSGLNGLLYRHSMRIYNNEKVRAEVRRRLKEKK